MRCKFAILVLFGIFQFINNAHAAEEIWLSDEPPLADQIYSHLRFPMGMSFDEGFIVKIKMSLSKDGSFLKLPTVLELDRMNEPGQHYFKVWTEAFLRALKSAEPFNLPIETYDIWKDMILISDSGHIYERPIKEVEESKLCLYEFGCYYEGCVGNCENGQGIYTWDDGTKYTGEWRAGDFHGQGTYTKSDGKQYLGEWRDGEFHGQGTYISTDGEQYVGEWEESFYHGEGTYTSTDGVKLIGLFTFGDYRGRVEDFFCIQGNCENGHGTYRWLDNDDQYVGEWRDGVLHGQGTYTSADKDQYVGEWEAGLRHGEGTNTWDDGTKYTGEWRDDAFHGQGTYTFSQGDNYIGEFKDNLFHGEGTYTGENGRKYIGAWENDEKHGYGNYICGSSNDDLGILDCKEGRIIIGIWARNNLWDVIEINF